MAAERRLDTQRPPLLRDVRRPTLRRPDFGLDAGGGASEQQPEAKPPDAAAVRGRRQPREHRVHDETGGAHAHLRAMANNQRPPSARPAGGTPAGRAGKFFCEKKDSRRSPENFFESVGRARLGRARNSFCEKKNSGRSTETFFEFAA